MSINHIRNFCIIAHIDHGKSTLADRILELTQSITKREMQAQVLDTLDIERERGITVKLQAVRLKYKARDGEIYTLNLIDTPGHVDFTYEVSRSLAACEGAILLADAAQGVEAQTVANFYLAFEEELRIIPVINKIDLPSANIEEVVHQLCHEFASDEDEILKISAKNNIGIEDVLESVIKLIPPPQDNSDKPLRALIFDSFYDPFRGAVMLVRVFDGSVKKGDKIKFFSNASVYEVEECGALLLGTKPEPSLGTGNVGYIIAGIRSIHDINTGDTITLANNPAREALPGYKPVKPMVYAGIYPADNDDYPGLQKAIEKLHLNDSALIYTPESSVALGFGYRCGFLGLLHLEIVQARLEREFDLGLVVTSPSVEVEVTTIKGEVLEIDNPIFLPSAEKIENIREPFVKAMIITPKEFVGNIISLAVEKRGIQQNMTYIDAKRVELHFELPLIEIVYDFYDRLKSVSKGYASFDYDFLDMRESDIVKVDILVNEEVVDALSFLAHKSNAENRGRIICTRLKNLIPRHMFKIPLQASVAGRIIARETINALRKNVTAKCYGGDISRKRKLLEKQKEGKKRMKSIGSVDIPQEAFISVLKVED